MIIIYRFHITKIFFDIVWSKETELLEEVSTHKFRQKDDINHWLIRYWQLCTGHFNPLFY